MCTSILCIVHQTRNIEQHSIFLFLPLKHLFSNLNRAKYTTKMTNENMNRNFLLYSMRMHLLKKIFFFTKFEKITKQNKHKKQDNDLRQFFSKI